MTQSNSILHWYMSRGQSKMTTRPYFHLYSDTASTISITVTILWNSEQYFHQYNPDQLRKPGNLPPSTEPMPEPILQSRCSDLKSLAILKSGYSSQGRKKVKSEQIWIISSWITEIEHKEDTIRFGSYSPISKFTRYWN